jgi:heme exporter protein A
MPGLMPSYVRYDTVIFFTERGDCVVFPSGLWYNNSAMQALELDNLSMAYGRRILFSGVSARVEPGESLVVTGANGAGKSTLLKIVAGLARPDLGEVRRPDGPNGFGYGAPDVQLYAELTGDENIDFFRRLRGLPAGAAQGLLAKCGLPESRGRDLVGAYSSGMRQRLKLAVSLLGSPTLLVWDEPTLALDAHGVEAVDSILSAHRQSRGIAILATNDADEASRWADIRLHVGPE